MSEETKEQSSKSGKENKSLIIIFGLVVIALLAVIVILLLGNRKEEAPQETERRNVVVNEENAEEVAKALLDRDTANQGAAAPRSYEVTMNSTWNFQDGASVSDNAYVENSTANSTDVYFDLQLADSEETIYESPIIPVGSHLDNIKLDKDLDAGTYNCVMIYHLVDEEQNTLGTLRMALRIVVAN